MGYSEEGADRMNMTAEGRRYIEEVIAKSRHRTLRFYSVSTCLGTSLGVALEGYIPASI